MSEALDMSHMQGRRTFSVDSSQVGVLEEGDKIGLSSFLKSHYGRRLEAKVRLYKA